MKKIILASLSFLLISFVTIEAQSPWKGFFKPTELRLQPTLLKGSLKASASTSQWLFTPAAFITADAVKLSGGVAITQPLSSIGTGISYKNFIDNNGTPYAQFSVSALILTNINLNGTSLTSLGGGLVVGAFNGLINIGVAYMGKDVYGLLGTTLKF